MNSHKLRLFRHNYSANLSESEYSNFLQLSAYRVDFYYIYTVHMRQIIVRKIRTCYFAAFTFEYSTTSCKQKSKKKSMNA